jgi:HEAT repeat protein
MARKDANKRHTAVPTQEKIAGVKSDKSKESKAPSTPVVAETPAQPKIVPTVAKSEATPATPAVAAAVANPAAATPVATSNVAELAATLRGADADAAHNAVISLGVSKDPAAVEPLIEAVRNVDGFFHSVVRAAAASALAHLGDARAVDALIGAINDPMAEASAEAVRSLAILGDARAVKPLIDVLRSTDGYFLAVVRRAAATALGKLGGEEAIAALKNAAEDTHEDAVIRSAAQSALEAKSA